MRKPDPLSAPMIDAMDYATSVGVLTRYAGQWWARERADTDNGIPTGERFTNRTVAGLVRRGWLNVTQVAGSRHRRTAIRVKVADRPWPPRE